MSVCVREIGRGREKESERGRKERERERQRVEERVGFTWFLARKGPSIQGLSFFYSLLDLFSFYLLYILSLF